MPTASLPSPVQTGFESFAEATEAVIFVDPDFRGLDTAEDLLKDAIRMDLLDDLKGLLLKTDTLRADPDGRAGLARDICYELAGAKNRDLAVDVLVHVTGIAEFGATSLRDYARKHGCSHEWFRKEAEAMRRRLGLKGQG